MSVDAVLDADAIAGAVAPPPVPLTAPSGAPTPRKLRGYQVEAADAVTAAFARGLVGPAVVLPTGSGKTTVIAELVRREVACGRTVLMMAHRNELIEQMTGAVVAVNPTGPVPAMIGGPHRDDPAAQVVSSTVQSLQRAKALAALGARDLVIVDECHHSVARTYLKVFEHFAASRRVGFTATMTRLSPAKGEPPLRDIWSEVVFERDLAWAIDQGFLIAPSGITVELPDLDVGGLHPGAGEITDDEAAEAMLTATTLNATVEAVITHTAGLSTIVFGASMAHCGEVAAALCANGVPAEMVVGETSATERTGIYRRFRAAKTRVLVTVDVLTEGADFPHCEAVVLARPTRSQARLVQCVGRALRPHTFDCGRVKDRALVVDLVGAGSLGLIVETELDRTYVARGAETGCGCVQPCIGDCDESCTGRGCGCSCSCLGDGDADEDESSTDVACTCSCSDVRYGICRCGCVCDRHRVDPLVVFDPITGDRNAPTKRRRGDSAWTQRTDTIRWARHPRGLVCSIYRIDGHKGVLMLADMRGVAGTVPGRDWAFGFFDSSVRRMTWVNTSGQWQEPAADCYLQGFSLAEADALANQLFEGHMRDQPRKPPSAAQIGLARALGIPDPDNLDRRDLSDMLALARADAYLPTFTQAVPPSAGERQRELR